MANLFECNASAEVVKAIEDAIKKEGPENPDFDFDPVRFTIIATLNLVERSGCLSEDLDVCGRCGAIVDPDTLYDEVKPGTSDTWSICDDCRWEIGAEMDVP